MCRQATRVVIFLCTLVSAIPGFCQEDAGKQSQNPIASLVSLPIQNNWNFGVGPDDRTQFVALVQPVIPLTLNEKWSLITRPIIPFVNSPIGPSAVEHGLSDMQWQNYFVPNCDEPSDWTFGFGPSFVIPTASEETLGLQRWGAGVNAVAVFSKDNIVGGALVNQNYIEGGVSKPFLLQPFYNYNFEGGLLDKSFITLSADFNADWEKVDEERWTNLVGIGPGKTVNFFGQLMNLSTRFAGYVAAPEGAPNWQFRFTTTLLFPK